MKQLLPKITIITPSYNQGQFLEQTISSIIEQDYPHLEFIIIDGGSTDHSVDIIKKYADRISYWISEKDQGTFDANNKALAKVTGDFWCVVNSDDLLLPGALNKVADAIINNPDQKWFAGGVHYIDETGRKTGAEMPSAPERIGAYTFVNGCWISHPTVFISTQVLQEIGYFEKYHLMDLNYWLRMEKKGYTPVILPEYLAALRIHVDCKSFDRIKIQNEINTVLYDFVEKNNLKTNQAVKHTLRTQKGNYYKIVLLTHLFNNERRQSIKLIKDVLKNNPAVVFKKWFWGAVKRMIFGINVNDPLVKEFAFNKSRANWN